MRNCKSKTNFIHEIQGGARGAIYALLNCVEIYFFNVTIRGNYVSIRRRRDRFGATMRNRQVESETELIKKLTRLAIPEVAGGAHGAIYGLLNCVEINLKEIVTIRENYVSNRRRRDRFGCEIVKSNLKLS